MQRQKISGVVRLEANGLFERCDNQAHNNHIGQIVAQALEALHLLHDSSRPSRRGSISNLLICSQSDHRILGLACDTKRDSARDSPATITNPQDLQKWWFLFAGQWSVWYRLSLSKNYVLDCCASGQRPVQGMTMTDETP